MAQDDFPITLAIERDHHGGFHFVARGQVRHDATEHYRAEAERYLQQALMRVTNRALTGAVLPINQRSKTNGG